MDNSNASEPKENGDVASPANASTNGHSNNHAIKDPLKWKQEYLSKVADLGDQTKELDDERERIHETLKKEMIEYAKVVRELTEDTNAPSELILQRNEEHHTRVLSFGKELKTNTQNKERFKDQLQELVKEGDDYQNECKEGIKAVEEQIAALEKQKKNLAIGIAAAMKGSNAAKKLYDLTPSSANTSPVKEKATSKTPQPKSKSSSENENGNSRKRSHSEEPRRNRLSSMNEDPRKGSKHSRKNDDSTDDDDDDDDDEEEKDNTDISAENIIHERRKRDRGNTSNSSNHARNQRRRLPNHSRR